MAKGDSSLGIMDVGNAYATGSITACISSIQYDTRITTQQFGVPLGKQVALFFLSSYTDS
jgi:hypothetical protein